MRHISEDEREMPASQRPDGRRLQQRLREMAHLLTKTKPDLVTEIEQELRHFRETGRCLAEELRFHVQPVSEDLTRALDELSALDGGSKGADGGVITILRTRMTPFQRLARKLGPVNGNSVETGTPLMYASSLLWRDCLERIDDRISALEWLTRIETMVPEEERQASRDEQNERFQSALFFFALGLEEGGRLANGDFSFPE